MPTVIDVVEQVPERELRNVMMDGAQGGATIVTAVNDGKGIFTVEATSVESSSDKTIEITGKMSHFGGPDDHGVGPNEDLAFLDQDDVAANPDLFLPAQPPGTTGAARRLNPKAMYLACRWNYAQTPKAFLKRPTTRVKVSANGKTIEARPADWGPNSRTGRIADLSPGLEEALGLDTDDECTVEIPLPTDGSGGVEAAPIDDNVEIDFAALDLAIFSPDVKRKLVAVTAFKTTTYWVVDQIGDQDGGQTLVRKIVGQAPEVLFTDSVVLPLKAGANVPDVVAQELNKAVVKEPEGPTQASDPAPGPGDDISKKVFAKATAFLLHSTRDVPDTENGNLACAWAVNEVVRLALGKPVSTQGSSKKNGLATADMFVALKGRHTRLRWGERGKAGLHHYFAVGRRQTRSRGYRGKEPWQSQ